MKLSGFTFVHNAIEAGYPIFEALDAVRDIVDEIVVVDMQSTDGTRELMYSFRDVRVLDGIWEPGKAGDCLCKAHAMYKECDGDVIVHFEADEVYDPRLIDLIKTLTLFDNCNLAAPRIQIEQNFQRARWYPEFVHRVFPKDADVVKEGHTTKYHQEHPIDVMNIQPGYGYLWDVTNCFRDSCAKRFENQAELWGHKPTYRFTPLHGYNPAVTYDYTEMLAYLEEPHWTWTASPFDLPEMLQWLVGVTNYAEYHNVS